MTSFAWSYTEPVDDFAAVRAFGIDVFRYGTTPTSAGNISSILTAADAARDNGVRLLVPLYGAGNALTYKVLDGRNPKTYTQGELDAVGAVVAQLDAHPAIYGYLTYDEPSLFNRFPDATRIQMYDYLKTQTDKPIVEVDYRIESGYFSNDSHDVFAFDWYVYTYGTVINTATGEIVSAGAETAALNDYASRLSSVASASTKPTFCLMQGFHNGGLAGYGPVPLGGFDKMWAKVVAAGLDGFGAGYYGWWFGLGANNIGLTDTVGEYQYTSAEKAEASAILTAASEMVAFADAETDSVRVDVFNGTPPFLIERRVV